MCVNTIRCASFPMPTMSSAPGLAGLTLFRGCHTITLPVSQARGTGVSTVSSSLIPNRSLNHINPTSKILLILVPSFQVSVTAFWFLQDSRGCLLGDSPAFHLSSPVYPWHWVIQSHPCRSLNTNQASIFLSPTPCDLILKRKCPFFHFILPQSY